MRSFKVTGDGNRCSQLFAWKAAEERLPKTVGPVHLSRWSLGGRF